MTYNAFSAFTAIGATIIASHSACFTIHFIINLFFILNFIKILSAPDTYRYSGKRSAALHIPEAIHIFSALYTRPPAKR